MNKTILIVDDEELTLMLTESALSVKYNTIRALSGEEAIKQYVLYQPDLVVADVMMPGMDGFEMLAEMKNRFGRRIPIIFMTANETEETEIKGLQYGAVDFMRKPLKPDQLLGSVNSFIERMEQIKNMQQ